MTKEEINRVAFATTVNASAKPTQNALLRTQQFAERIKILALVVVMYGNYRQITSWLQRRLNDFGFLRSPDS